MKLLGSSLVAIKELEVLYCLICFAIIFFVARHMFGTAAGFLTIFCLASLPLLILTALQLLGEILAFTLCFASLAFFAGVNGKQTGPVLMKILLGSALVAFSVLTKDIFVIFLISVAIISLLDYFIEGHHTRINIFLVIGPVILTVIALLVWYIARYSLISTVQYNWLNFWKLSMTNQYTYQWQTRIFAPMSHSSSAFNSLIEYYLPFLFTALVLITARITHLVNSIASTRENYIQKILFLNFVLWLFWYVFISAPLANNRHFLGGIGFLVLFSIGETKLIYRRICKEQFYAVKKAFSVSVMVLLVVCFFFAAIQGWNWNNKNVNSLSSSLQAQAAEWVKYNVSPNQALSGWGWYIPWDIALLADRRPNQVTIGAIVNDDIDWFVITPELTKYLQSAPDNDLVAIDLTTYVKQLGAPAFNNTMYQIYRVSKPQSAIQSVTIGFDKAFPETVEGTGWGEPEPKNGGSWMVNPTSILKTWLVDGNSYTIRATVSTAIQPDILSSLSLSVNGVPIALKMTKEANNSTTFTGVISQTVVASDKTQTSLKFAVSRVVSPVEFGLGQDSRTLGVFFTQLQIMPQISRDQMPVTF